MDNLIEIKGGASEFEAAVIAVVLDRITRDELAARQGRSSDRGLSAWVRALQPGHPHRPRETVWPE